MKNLQTMKKRSWYKLFILLLLSFTLNNIYPQNDNKYKSLLFNEDGSVTFIYNNPKAKKVKIYCDCRLHIESKSVKRENYHKAKMKKTNDKIWYYTTPPLAPEVYTYHFSVDGEMVPDPLNSDSVRVRTDKLSVFVITGTSQSDLYISDTLSGKVDTLSYENPYGGKIRNLFVYTPPQYYIDTTLNYPLLYLLHGLNGNESAWNDRGRATQILDNLIKNNKVEPLILVMPDANPECLISQKEDVGLMKNIFLYPTWNKLEFENAFLGIDSFLSTKYRSFDIKGGRAVAGLSAGAKQAANLANMYDSTFKYVGLFSPVVRKKHLPKDNYSKYWIGGGTSDLFHYQINKFRKKMQRRHIPYTMYNSMGGHTWRNWRVYLTEFAQFLKF